MGIVQYIFLFLRAFLIGRATVAFENLALRQQVAAFKHSAKRPKLRRRDRIFWVLLSRFWPHWRSALAIVQVRNGHQMAANGIQTVLEVEIQGRQARTPAYQTGDS